MVKTRVYKNQNLKNHQAEISHLVLSKTVSIEQITTKTNRNDKSLLTTFQPDYPSPP